MYTVYGKTFKEENFCSFREFLALPQKFPMYVLHTSDTYSLLVALTANPDPQNFSSERCFSG